MSLANSEFCRILLTSSTTCRHQTRETKDQEPDLQAGCHIRYLSVPTLKIAQLRSFEETLIRRTQKQFCAILHDRRIVWARIDVAPELICSSGLSGSAPIPPFLRNRLSYRIVSCWVAGTVRRHSRDLLRNGS